MNWMGMDAFEPLRLVASGCSQCGHGHRESMDPGFSAYLGLVLTDAHYSNPTLLSFVSLLWGSQMRKPPLPPPAASIQPDSDDDIPLLDLASLTDDEKDRRAGESRWRRKWCVFLVFSVQLARLTASDFPFELCVLLPVPSKLICVRDSS